MATTEDTFTMTASKENFERNIDATRETLRSLKEVHPAQIFYQSTTIRLPDDGGDVTVVIAVTELGGRIGRKDLPGGLEAGWLEVGTGPANVHVRVIY